MSDDTLTALSQRDGAFWIGLGLLVVGALTLSHVGGDTSLLGRTLFGLGATVLTVRVLVGIYRIFRHSFEAGRIGYEEEKPND